MALLPGPARSIAGAARRLTFERLAATLLFLCLGTAACLMPAQSDTFWQLRAGQEMVATGRVLLEDTFTHTVYGGYWPNHEWLSHVVFYLLWAAGGLPLLTAFAAALVVLSWACMWRLMPGPVLFRAAVLLVVVLPTAKLWSLRPQLISFFLLALTVVVCRTGRRWLPVLFVVWANFHGGVMVGLAAAGGMLAAGSLADRTRWRASALTLAACAVAVCVTPLGFSVWTEIPHMLERLALYDVQEWRRASPWDPLMLPFWCVGAALPVLAWRARRSLNAEQAALVGGALALLPLAIQSSRNIASFMLLSAPALAILLPELAARLGRRRASERPAFNAAVASAAAVASIALVAYAWAKPLARLNWTPISPEAARSISACGGNVYNRYDEGGYLVWFVPGTPVFMDSRQDPFPAPLVIDHIRAERTGEYEELFARHDIRCAALPATSQVARRLTEAGWQVAHADAQWHVFQAGDASRRE